MKTQIVQEIEKLLALPIISKSHRKQFSDRLFEGNLTRDENPDTHFCVYFAAFDLQAREVFIGQHKKSGLWLFNGGHIDKGEMLLETLMREISEEWGIPVSIDRDILPSNMTLTKILPNPNMNCCLHYDIWYFIPVEKNKFAPLMEKINEEFYEMKWFTPVLAKKKVTDPNTLKTIDMMQKQFR